MSRIEIPVEATDKHIALLGMTGAGKTSVAKTAIVEPDLADGRRVVIIDPTAAWWGLRLKRNGTSKGFPIYIFGGEHGDYPLKAASAALLAEAFATSSDSAIFDVSLMTVAERTAFFTEFVETFRRKNKGWVRFVIDEAHLFMPQQGAKAGGAVPAMLHAGNNLVSLGRSRGIRVAMISQRASKLHKDSLTQASALIAMRLMHPLDRKAVREWVDDQADPGEGEKVISSLSHLHDGEAWVWAPMAKMLERIQFARPQTFDSSAAPDLDAGTGPVLAPLDLDLLKGKLATVEAERKANDPKELKAEIARLKNMQAATTVDRAAITEAEKAGYERGKSEMAQACDESAKIERASFVSSIKGIAADAIAAFDKLVAGAKPGTVRAPNFVPVVAQRQVVSPMKTAVRSSVPTPRGGGDASLSKGQRVVLTAAAQHTGGVTREQLTVLTGYKRSSRDTFVQQLRYAGFLNQSGDRLVTTDAGIEALGEFETLPTGDDLRRHWLDRLGGGEKSILEIVCRNYPNAVDRERISELTPYKRSSRDTFIQKLIARQLVKNAGPGIVRASDALFGA